MKLKNIHIIILFALCILPDSLKADVYYIFYATIDGKSGHAGIAIDNYKIIVKDILSENNKKTTVYDTIPTGTLTYYDLWPEKDEFNALNVDKDVTAKYFKLPAASWENPITISSLLTQGIPHEEDYPVDGLIQFKSTPQKDDALKTYIEAIIAKNQSFNVRTFNCADFVEISIEKHCNCTITADESIFLKQSTTPNRLYQEVSKLNNINIIKDASEKAKGAFTMQRLLKKPNNK